MFIVAESVVPALSLPTMERRRCETDREDEHRSRELHSVDDGQQKKARAKAVVSRGLRQDGHVRRCWLSAH